MQRAPQAPPVSLSHWQQHLQLGLKEIAPNSVLTNCWGDFAPIYTKLIRDLARHHGVAGTKTDDFVQEIWSRVLGHFADFRWHCRSGNLMAWFHRLVRNQAIDHYRRLKHRQTQPLPNGFEAQAAVQNDASDPARHFDQRVSREIASRLLKQLREDVGDEDFRIFERRWIKEQSVTTIAVGVGLTPNAVSCRLKRMLEKLRVYAAVFGGGWFGAVS